MQRLEETCNQQLEEMEALYGATMIVPTSESRDLAGSTRSSLSSYSEGWNDPFYIYTHARIHKHVYIYPQKKHTAAERIEEGSQVMEYFL